MLTGRQLGAPLVLAVLLLGALCCDATTAGALPWAGPPPAARSNQAVARALEGAGVPTCQVCPPLLNPFPLLLLPGHRINSTNNNTTNRNNHIFPFWALYLFFLEGVLTVVWSPRLQDAPIKDLPFCNTSLTAGQRTEDLVSRMVRNQPDCSFRRERERGHSHIRRRRACR
jgi:hypothetical protein